jgi:hypothetical protein
VEDDGTLQNKEDMGGGGCKMEKTRRKGPCGLLTGDGRSVQQPCLVAVVGVDG